MTSAQTCTSACPHCHGCEQVVRVTKGNARIRCTHCGAERALSTQTTSTANRFVTVSKNLTNTARRAIPTVRAQHTAAAALAIFAFTVVMLFLGMIHVVSAFP